MVTPCEQGGWRCHTNLDRRGAGFGRPAELQAAVTARHVRNASSLSRLLKKSVRLRNEECKRDFLRLDAAQVRSFGVKSGRCSLALHVAGRASPLGARSLGRRTML